MADNSDSANYVKMIVYVFLGLGSFIMAIVTAYFGGVGLFFGQGIVEQDVFEDKYKYECAVEVDGKCTQYNTSAPLPSWQNYETFRGDINDTIPLYIQATTVIFALLGLVFLFLALKTSGLWRKKDSNDKSMNEY